MICASLTSPTTEQAIEQMKRASERADLVELRLDYMQEYDLRALLRDRPCPVIVTNRPEGEGGKHQSSEAERIAPLKEAIQLSADYVDIELDSVGQIGARESTKIIVSYHNFNETPSLQDLKDIHHRLENAGADIAKIAVYANSLRDNLTIFDLLQGSSLPTIGLCMGELGQISRILTIKFGGFLTFGSVQKGTESAPGQLAIEELRRLYRVNEANADTRIYGVIGNPVAHSMSPAIHNAAFRERSINAVYVPFKVEGDAAAFINEFKRMNVQGYSVTVPHKQAVMEAMDDIDDIAKSIVAMNTVVNRDGRLFGYNTDWSAAVKVIEKALGDDGTGASLQGKSVLLVGAGGSARAIAFGLKRKGAHITIVNRTHQRAVNLAKDVGCSVRPLSDLPDLKADILVNSTSVGMHPSVHDTPIPKNILEPGRVVFDAVYNPLETRLLREAKEQGCTIATGFDMFINQAVEQFEMWTGTEAPVELMARVAKERLVG